MRPEGQGRFCGACSKTVVDFSMMTDGQILLYLARSGEQVCGRVALEQLNREIVAGPARSKGWRGWWHWVLAGVLLSTEAKAQQAPKVPSEQVVKKVVGETGRDSIKIKELPEVVVRGFASGRISGAMMISVRVDTFKTWVADTLASLGWKQELSIYPNPVRKGMAVSLSWQGMEPGFYMVELFNAAGAVVRQRAMQVSAKEQVDLLEIPASLSGGIYFLRAAKAGETKPITRKLVVL
jgi:Secretion system C-terminal sorting domain